MFDSKSFQEKGSDCVAFCTCLLFLFLFYRELFFVERHASPLLSIIPLYFGSKLKVYFAFLAFSFFRLVFYLPVHFCFIFFFQFFVLHMLLFIFLSFISVYCFTSTFRLFPFCFPFLLSYTFFILVSFRLIC